MLSKFVRLIFNKYYSKMFVLNVLLFYYIPDIYKMALLDALSVKQIVIMLSLVFFTIQMVLALQKYMDAPKMTSIGNKTYN